MYMSELVQQGYSYEFLKGDLSPNPYYGVCNTKKQIFLYNVKPKEYTIIEDLLRQADNQYRGADGMKGEIDSDGTLRIDRGAVKRKAMLCPFQESINGFCGDWCPHFGEPIFYNDEWCISLCHGKTLSFNRGEFEDMRSQV